MSRQVALCLGIGGLGCSVALGLCRLGVKKVILVDHDCVEAHNLNRYVLASPALRSLTERHKTDFVQPRRHWQKQGIAVLSKLCFLSCLFWFVCVRDPSSLFPNILPGGMRRSGLANT